MTEAYQERIGSTMTTLPPVGEPKQLAATSTFLLSDDGTDLNEVVLATDGGWSVI